MKFNHPLMNDNIDNQDVDILLKFIKKKPIFTNNKKVFEFEKIWSKWLGVKYSLFVNSGSSANLLTIAYLKHLYPWQQPEMWDPCLLIIDQKLVKYIFV